MIGQPHCVFVSGSGSNDLDVSGEAYISGKIELHVVLKDDDESTTRDSPTWTVGSLEDFGVSLPCRVLILKVTFSSLRMARK